MREARDRQARRTSLPVLLLCLLALASCKEGSFYEALGDQLSASLRIAPPTGTIPNGSSLAFSATGGAPPYSYSIVSGPGAIDVSTGMYTSGGGGVVVVRVTDANKKTSDASITVTTTGAPNVDYGVASITQTGPLLAGGPISESFTLQNNGTDAGLQNVQWTAYVSSDSLLTISAGDKVIDAGSRGPLGAAPASASIGISGTWPAANGTYHLKVKVSAPDDVDSANNVLPSAAYTTTYVDYTVGSVTVTGPYLAGNAINASFTLENVGSANGAQAVSWSAYVSTDNTLGGGDTLVASGTAGHLDSGASSDVPVAPITGTWPAAIGGTYFLVVSVSAPDDTGAAANVGASGGCLLAAPTVNYVVSAVAAPGGSVLPAGTLTSSFQLSNTGANNGSQLVSWSAYASLSTAVDGTAILVASGTWPPLATGAGAVAIPFSGPWPLHYGAYHLVVSASAGSDVESNVSDNVAATVGTTAVGMINEAEPNNDATALLPAGVQDLGITLRPGMSVLVTRSLAGADVDDVFAFNTGTAASVSLYMSWGSAGSQNVNLRFKKDAPVVTLAAGNTAAGTSLSLSWNVDASSSPRWIDANNAAGETAYTLIITGN